MLFDKHGIEIHEYDLLKVYHFTDHRRKKHYIYKHVRSVNSTLRAMHLDGSGGGYFLAPHLLEETEIIQGNTPLSERRKNES